MLHSFCLTGGSGLHGRGAAVGRSDGRCPWKSLWLDLHRGHGFLPTYEYAGCGTDWEVSPPAGGSGPWTFNVIYSSPEVPLPIFLRRGWFSTPWEMPMELQSTAGRAPPTLTVPLLS